MVRDRSDMKRPTPSSDIYWVSLTDSLVLQVPSPTSAQVVKLTNSITPQQREKRPPSVQSDENSKC